MGATGDVAFAFIFKVNSDVGRAWLSAFTAAKLAGSSVFVNGTGTCPTNLTENSMPPLPVGIGSYEQITHMAIQN